MRYGIIDIGSNSVRLLVSDDMARVYKKINTTGLGRGLALTGRLSEDRMIETAKAVVDFVEEAKENGCEEVYVFATEAVRSAQNRSDFLQMLLSSGISVDVVASEDEAKLGFAGAYTKGRCCVMDIGGASTELAVGDENGLIYAKSMPVGLVRIFDNCKEDCNAIDKYIADIIKGYGQIPEFDELLSIGGTASTFVAMNENMKEYNPKVVDNYKLTLNVVEEWTKKIHVMDMEERLKINGLEPKRRNVIVGGGMLLSALMRMLGRDCVIVRESDNQEGYLLVKLNERLNKSKMHLFRQSDI
ncbi:MAG: hypothetical protein HDT29_04060 [Clostridiales bacterium]|nr:hypothetical protein [Clostridiales bacterium]